MNEIELKFLDVDVSLIEQKLESLGATFIGEDFLEEWLFWRLEWSDYRGRVRLRSSGENHELAYKETTRGTGEGNLELEFSVSDAPIALDFLKKVIGSENIRHQQKRRKSYEIDCHEAIVSVDIDYWPRIPPYIEIESENRTAIDRVVNQLNLDVSQAVELDAKDIYLKIYNIDISGIKELVF